MTKLDGEIIGWAALSPISNRCVYKGVGEVSVYVGSMSRGLGIGTYLLKRLIDTSEKEDYWTLQSSIFPENAASLSLHKNYGFKEIGRRERIGKLNGVWRDTILLERRSSINGID